jgi:hypothetical protein
MLQYKADSCEIKKGREFIQMIKSNDDEVMMISCDTNQNGDIVLKDGNLLVNVVAGVTLTARILIIVGYNSGADAKKIQ